MTVSLEDNCSFHPVLPFLSSLLQELRREWRGREIERERQRIEDTGLERAHAGPCDHGKKTSVEALESLCTAPSSTGARL